MNKNESTALALVALILIAVLAVMSYVSWRRTTSNSHQNQEALVSQSILSEGNQTTSTKGVATKTLTTSSSSSAVLATATLATSSIATTQRVSAITIVPAPGWQVYREAEYGVAGTFPKTWYEYDAVGLGGSLQFTSVPQADATAGGMIDTGDAEITIYRTLESFTQARAEDSLNGVEQGITTATVAHTSVYVVAYRVASSENTLVAYVPQGDYLYRIILAYHGETSFANTFSQFLATFQFSN